MGYIDNKENLTQAGYKRAEKELRFAGFDSDGYTYIATGDTFSIKDVLKEEGFRFSKFTLWHIAEPPAERECIKMHFDDLAQLSSWGEIFWNADARAKVDDALRATLPPSESEYIGESGEKFDLEVEFKGMHTFEGMYGISHCYSFCFDGTDMITWFSTKELDLEPGDIVQLSGKIKKCQEYRGEKQTVVTRCKVS